MATVTVLVVVMTPTLVMDMVVLPNIRTGLIRRFPIMDIPMVMGMADDIPSSQRRSSPDRLKR
jgi:hypothetical protein